MGEECGQSVEVLRFRALLVSDAEFFSMETLAIETMATIYAVFQVVAVRAVHTVFRPEESGTSVAIGTLVTIIAFPDAEAVVAVGREPAVGGVVAGNAFSRVECQVTVLTDPRVVRVIRILVGGVMAVERKKGERVAELLELREKGFAEIEIPSVAHRIPFVAPPEILRVDRKRLVRGIQGNDVFAGRVALAFVELSFVSE